MQSTAPNVTAYIEEAPPERREALAALRTTLKKNLPEGFKETMAYGMPAYVVPHTRYPQGYHCDPKIELPFISFASQKNFIALYHMGMYTKPDLLQWFTTEYSRAVKGKPDMGKSCVRFKKPEHLPLDLIGKLASKMSVVEWITLYEKNLKR